MRQTQMDVTQIISNDNEDNEPIGQLIASVGMDGIVPRGRKLRMKRG
jgi:hypothetical protein